MDLRVSYFKTKSSWPVLFAKKERLLFSYFVACFEGKSDLPSWEKGQKLRPKDPNSLVIALLCTPFATSKHHSLTSLFPSTVCHFLVVSLISRPPYFSCCWLHNNCIPCIFVYLKDMVGRKGPDFWANSYDVPIMSKYIPIISQWIDRYNYYDWFISPLTDDFSWL